jgi:hypothetical protein
VKPKVFIGSSRESERVANAIHRQLKSVAECTPWSAGAFDISKGTLEDLMRNLRESDFGIFVFSADDDATIRGNLLKVARDNVIFEAGLFAGYLGSDRCFIVVPQETRIHLPSDLAGITVGDYEDNRTDTNFTSAVNGFCDIVRQNITDQGLFQGTPRDRLRDLVVQFECCQWIAVETARIEKKRAVYSGIDAFCKSNPLNKHRLLAQNHPGYNVALLSAIRYRPEPRDWQLIKQINLANLPPGFAYYKLMDAVEALKASHNITTQQLQELQIWLKALPNQDLDIASRVKALFP